MWVPNLIPEITCTSLIFRIIQTQSIKTKVKFMWRVYALTFHFKSWPNLLEFYVFSILCLFVHMMPVMKENWSVYWILHYTVFNKNQIFLIHLSVLPKRNEIIVICKCNNSFTFFFWNRVQILQNAFDLKYTYNHVIIP